MSFHIIFGSDHSDHEINQIFFPNKKTKQKAKAMSDGQQDT